MSREGERGRSALSAAAMQSWKGKACLVVGGSGNLGGDLIDLLIERGATVCIFDNLPYDGAHGERVSNHVGDITTDFGRMKLEAACSMMDVVFHMASVVDLTPIPDPRMSEINVKGTLNVIDACVAAEVPTLVYTSIAEVICGKRADGSRVIGTRKAPLDESVGYPAKHTLEYFATKAAAERYVLSANGPRLRTVVLRPGYFCGAESFALRLEITKAIMYQHNNYIATKAPGIRSCVNVKNCALAHLLAAERAARPEVNGQAFFLRDFEASVHAQTVAAIEGSGVKIILLPFSLACAITWVLHYWEVFLYYLYWCVGMTRHISEDTLAYATMDMVRYDMCVSSEKAKAVLGYGAPGEAKLLSQEETQVAEREWARGFAALLYAQLGK